MPLNPTKHVLYFSSVILFTLPEASYLFILMFAVFSYHRSVPSSIICPPNFYFSLWDPHRDLYWHQILCRFIPFIYFFISFYICFALAGVIVVCISQSGRYKLSAKYAGRRNFTDSLLGYIMYLNFLWKLILLRMSLY